VGEKDESLIIADARERKRKSCMLSVNDGYEMYFTPMLLKYLCLLLL
jgi:hypothetical protein